MKIFFNNSATKLKKNPFLFTRFLICLFAGLKIHRFFHRVVLWVMDKRLTPSPWTIHAGDINCNYLVPSDHKEIKSILASLGLKQLISTPTRITHESKTLIDIICSNEPEKINSLKVISAGMSDHELICCSRKLNNVKNHARIITC